MNQKCVSILFILSAWCAVGVSIADEIKEPPVEIKMPSQSTGAVSLPAPSITAQSAVRTVEVDAVKQDGAVEYGFEIEKVVSESESKLPEMHQSKNPTLKIQLKPGEYRIRTRALINRLYYSQWGKKQRLFVPFLPPAILYPLNGQQLFPSTDNEMEVDLIWKIAESPARYVVRVTNRKDELITETEVVSKNFLTVKLKEDAAYKWSVSVFPRDISFRALSSVKELTTDSEFSIEKYSAISLSIAEEPSRWYGWARLIGSRIAYSGQNFDQATQVEQSILGGHIDLATGHWFPGNKWGVLLNGVVSTYGTQGSIYNYFSVGALGGYRLKLSDGASIRFWAGAAYVVLPEVIGILATQTFTVEKIQTLGPQIQISYTQPFTSKIGLHVYGISYAGLFGLKTPNNQPVASQYALQAGVQGSYLLSEAFKLLAGYTFKYESSAYKSTVFPDQNNSSQLMGHYFSVTLEAGLFK